MRKRIICAVLSLTFSLAVFVPAYGTEVPSNDFHTEEQYEYILRSQDDLNAIRDYADGNAERSIPDPILCEFWDDGIPQSDRYVFQKSATADFEDCVTVTGLVLKEYEYYNALLGEHFFWRGGSDLETISESPVHEVTVTTQTPRNCYVPGLTNVRDVGGYESSLVPGGKIRQGLYYRGGQIDNITDEGIAVLADDLGVRAEIDLRGFERAGGYRKGFEKIAYHSAIIGMDEGEDLFSAHDYSRIYSLISEAGENPVYLHCIAGADRTGIVTFMLLTACGVSFRDAAFDYVFTCFSTHGPRYLRTAEDWYARLGDYDGETKADKAKNWIISKGVSEETVEVIRETFVEGYESGYLKAISGSGDANGDGNINSRDVILVMKAALPGFEPPAGYSARAVDMNGDGKINSRDVIALMKRVLSQTLQTA